jgi:hypothetical protein
MNSITRFVAGGMASLALLGLAVAGGSTVDAKGKAGEIRIAGECTGRSTSKLKVKPEDGRMLEVEFEVDQNVNGARWRVVMKNDGQQFFAGTRVTAAPSGSFSVERLSADGTGKDLITAFARNARTGETCEASISY